METASVHSNSSPLSSHSDARPCWFSPQSVDDVYQGLTTWTDTGRYYSFPSFDTWDIGEQDKENDEDKST